MFTPHIVCDLSKRSGIMAIARSVGTGLGNRIMRADRQALAGSSKIPSTLTILKAMLNGITKLSRAMSRYGR